MSESLIYSIIESAAHPRASALYEQMGFNEKKFTAMRKALSALKKEKPAFLVAEFFYGYGNNYAGVNVSNLDTLLSTLQRYTPDTRVVVLASKEELVYVDKLKELFPIHAVIQQPADLNSIQAALKS